MTPYLEDTDLRLYQGDVLEVLKTLEPESVHCVVTSPPYWGLRDYSAIGQLGLEATPDLYVERMVAVFREVRRVLRRDGTCWLNVGDSYNAHPSGSRPVRSLSHGLPQPTYKVGAGHRPDRRLKEKDLCMIPARLALALQADGWWLRSQIVWSKPNPMPESVTDRPTTSHEFVLLLTRSPRYFFDQEAVREQSITNDPRRPYTSEGAWQMDGRDEEQKHGGERRNGDDFSSRNVRSVWQIATQPYPEAHFATYPEELVRRCILAGTSERGCCPECGAPWTRETTSERTDSRPGNSVKLRQITDGNAAETGRGGDYSVQTVGWRPSCQGFDGTYGTCNEPGTVPCTVLDPFFGSGTTGLVARKHGRKTIGVELSPEYCELAAKRLQQLSLLYEAGR